MNLTLCLRVICEGDETSEDQLRFVSAVANLLRQAVPILIEKEFGNVNVVLRDSTLVNTKNSVDECNYSRDELLRIGLLVAKEPPGWQNM
jgi:hypothetical protein